MINHCDKRDFESFLPQTSPAPDDPASVFHYFDCVYIMSFLFFKYIIYFRSCKIRKEI